MLTPLYTFHYTHILLFPSTDYYSNNLGPPYKRGGCETGKYATQHQLFVTHKSCVYYLHSKQRYSYDKWYHLAVMVSNFKFHIQR